MRYTLKGLTPATTYAIQVRVVRPERKSEWSRRFIVTTINNSTKPDAPTNIVWVSVGDGFYGEWDSVGTNESGQNTKIERYEVRLIANGIPKIVSVPQNTGSRISFSLPYQQILALWAVPMFEIGMQVRSVDAWDRKSEWSSLITAANAAPGPLTNFVANPIRDGVELSWEPPTDDDLAGFRVYVGESDDFIPSQSNKIYYGTGTRVTYATSTYAEHFFKACAVDKFGQEGPFATASAVPKNPFSVDTEAPDIPSNVIVVITNNESNTVATADVSWSLAETPTDLGGFHIRYREVGTLAYYQASVDASATSVSIVLPEVFKNYEFQVTAYDFMANYSGWSDTVVGFAPTNEPPSQVLSVNVVSGLDSIQITWPQVPDTDVANGAGTYEIDVSESSVFASGVLSYNTGSTSISINGLDLNTTYYVRVRAKDAGGLVGAWSTTAQGTTGNFPETSPSDGHAPGYSPNVEIVPRVGSLYARWAPVVTNANGGEQLDLVKYEIHASVTDDFTPNPGTKVTETYGLSASLYTTAGGTPLDYDTIYFVKVVARDADGAAAAGLQASGSPLRAGSGDIDIEPGDIGAVAIEDLSTIVGANKVTWSTVAPTNEANAAGDVWFVRNATTGLVTQQWEGLGGNSWAQRTLSSDVIANLTVGKLTSGVIDTQIIQISETGQIRSTDFDGTHGWSLSTGALIIREGFVHANAIVAGSGFVNNLIISTGGGIQSENYSTSQGFRLSETGLIIRGEGNIVSASTLKGGTVTGTDIIVGVGGTLTIDQTGQLKSNNYSLGSTGYRLSSSGLEVNTGEISAAALKSGTAIIGVLTVGDSPGQPGEIKSANYSPNVSGFRLSSTGLELNSGSITAGAIALQIGENLMPPAYADFEAQPSFYNTGGVVVSGGGAIVGINYSSRTNLQSLGAVWSTNTANPLIWLGTSQTDYNIPVEGGKQYIVSAYMWAGGSVPTNVFLKVKWSNGTSVTVGSALLPASGTGPTATRVYGTVTAPSGVTGAIVFVESSTWTNQAGFNIDAVQFETKQTTSNTPSSWRPPGATRIDGSIIRTGSIISNMNGVTWNGSSWVNSGQPAWSINMTGEATFRDAWVRGRLMVGELNSSAIGSAIQSGNYLPGVRGWQIDSAGAAKFYSMEAYGGFIQGTQIRTAQSGNRIEINTTGPQGTWGSLQFISATSGWGACGIVHDSFTSTQGNLVIFGPRLQNEWFTAGATIWMSRNTADTARSTEMTLQAKRLTFTANKFFLGSANDTSIDFNMSSSNNTLQFKSVTGPASSFNISWGSGDIVLEATNGSGTRKRLMLYGQGIELNTNAGTRNIVARFATNFPESPSIGDTGANAFLVFRNVTNPIQFTTMDGSTYVNVRANKFIGVLEAPSDREKKNNIEPIANGVLSKLKNINVYSYDLYNSSPEGPPQNLPVPTPPQFVQHTYGVMADELEAQFADIVSTADGEKSVNLYGLIAVAIKGIKELTELVEAQSTKIAALETNRPGNRP